MPIVDRGELPNGFDGGNNGTHQTRVNRDASVRNESARKLILSSTEVDLCKLSAWLIKRVLNQLLVDDLI